MGDDTTLTSASETPNEVTSGETPQTSATSETQSANNSTDLSHEIERLTSSLKRANAEAKQYREKATELDKLKAEIEAAKLSETERLQKELADLKALRESEIEAQFEKSVRSSISMEAAKLGVDPAALKKLPDLINWEEIDVDDNGEVTNIPDLIAQLLKEMPMLKSRNTVPSAGGATNPSRSHADANAGEITASYVADLMSGKISWQSLTPERRSAVLNWQAQHAYRF